MLECCSPVELCNIQQVLKGDTKSKENSLTTFCKCPYCELCDDVKTAATKQTSRQHYFLKKCYHYDYHGLTALPLLTFFPMIIL